MEEAERHATVRVRPFESVHAVSTGVAVAAVEAAQCLGGALIVARTQSGRIDRLISELRPGADVLGLTPAPADLRRMALYRGVASRLAHRFSSTDPLIAWTMLLVRRARLAPRGGALVLVVRQPLDHSTTQPPQPHRPPHRPHALTAGPRRTLVGCPPRRARLAAWARAAPSHARKAQALLGALTSKPPRFKECA